MFTNMQQEMQTDLALRVELRVAATSPGYPIDCEPPGLKDYAARVAKKYRLAFFTVIVGEIADGTHEVIVEQSVDGVTWYPTGVTTGNLVAGNSDSTMVLKVHRGAKVRYLRLNHKVTGASAKGGGVISGVAHQAKAIDITTQVDIERILRQEIYAVGYGADMPIESDAIEWVCLLVRDGLYVKLNTLDPLTPTVTAADNWNRVKYFLFDCCKEIGLVAARDAHTRGKIAIPYAVYDKTKTPPELVGGILFAYNKVSAANNQGAAGDYCPPDV